MGALDAGPAGAVAAALSPWGFWTGRGAVSYTTSGAFVRWLLDRYGADRLRAVYRTADFEGVYGASARSLAQVWETELRRMPVTVEAESLAAWRFRQPSLFERPCPHYVPPAVRLTRAAAEAEAAGRADAARRLYARAAEADTAYAPALAGWARRVLADEARPLAPGAGPGQAVAARLRAAVDPSAPDPILLVGLGDAYRLAGRDTLAAQAYEAAVAALPPWDDASAAFVGLRRSLTPVALRVLLGAGPPEARALALERLMPSAPAAGVFAAARWLEAGDPARALVLLERLPLDALAPDAAAARALRAFRAGAADRARAYDRSLRYARAAEADYRAAGEESRARLMADLAGKAAWMLRGGGA